MSELKFNSHSLSMLENETVLDCLLRHQQQIPYACKAGTCQACLIKTEDCEAPLESSKWIKQPLRDQGYTLACQWVPKNNSTISVRLPAVNEFSQKVHIKILEKLNSRTLKVILTLPDQQEMFHYFPGQYLTLINPTGTSRPYSIANNYEVDQFIELHISQTQYGIFTQWLFNEAIVGDQLYIKGPGGDCFLNLSEDNLDTTESSSIYPLLLAGTGTGLAPLYSIAHEALRQGYQGPILLFHGGTTIQQLYYFTELTDLQQLHSQFHYFPCVTKQPTTEVSSLYYGDLETVLKQQIQTNDLPNTRAFLCGKPEVVHHLRKRLFLQGVKSANIYSDPFVERVLAPQ